MQSRRAPIAASSGASWTRARGERARNAAIAISRDDDDGDDVVVVVATPRRRRHRRPARKLGPLAAVYLAGSSAASVCTDGRNVGVLSHVSFFPFPFVPQALFFFFFRPTPTPRLTQHNLLGPGTAPAADDSPLRGTLTCASPSPLPRRAECVRVIASRRVPVGAPGDHMLRRCALLLRGNPSSSSAPLGARPARYCSRSGVDQPRSTLRHVYNSSGIRTY